ncbi:hypothetical protein U9M48_001739 [Paspalum notatum var. saurae]|uniref:Uncharacterized protein n=1 Tax=Paspalum notatum var. saurae TaxID=547442 RepID=A0AAQ3SJ90_PASNO
MARPAVPDRQLAPSRADPVPPPLFEPGHTTGPVGRGSAEQPRRRASQVGGRGGGSGGAPAGVSRSGRAGGSGGGRARRRQRWRVGRGVAERTRGDGSGRAGGPAAREPPSRRRRPGCCGSRGAELCSDERDLCLIHLLLNCTSTAAAGRLEAANAALAAPDGDAMQRAAARRQGG